MGGPGGRFAGFSGEVCRRMHRREAFKEAAGSLVGLKSRKPWPTASQEFQ